MVKKLKVPKGTDEVNFGTQAYHPNEAGIVEVPDEAAAPLLETGGCVEIGDQESLADGYSLVAHLDPNAACAGGERFGDFIRVPSSMVAELESHGFTVVHLPAPPEPNGNDKA